MAYLKESKQYILTQIDGWEGELTWDMLGAWCQQKFGLKKKPSRHTLQGDGDIKLAFQTKKNRLRDKKVAAVEKAKLQYNSSEKLSELLAKHGSEDTMIAALIKRADEMEKQMEKLSAENDRLKSTNNILLERFQRWQYNLSRMDNVDMNKLAATIDNGLPANNRA